MSAIERLDKAFDAALDECPVSEILGFLLSNFVGLAVELARRNGGDVEASEIKIDGGNSRDVTIGPAKPARATGKGE